ncbi:MAG: hypothetical protein ACYDEY_05350 [Acidimicrobiales bacterium]
MELDAVRAQANDVRSEIAENELLCSGTVSSFDASSLSDLATLLIKTRVVRGWALPSSRCSAMSRPGTRAASLARICDVASVVGVTVTERAVLENPDAD